MLKTESNIDFINSKINLELINKIKEISIPYLDNCNSLSYTIELEDYNLAIGSFQTQTEIVPDRLKGLEREIFIKQLDKMPKDWIYIIDFYDEYFEKVKSDFKNNKKLKYGFRLYKTVCSDQRGKPINKIGQKNLLSKIKKLFPNEEIYIIIN